MDLIAITVVVPTKTICNAELYSCVLVLAMRAQMSHLGACQTKVFPCRNVLFSIKPIFMIPYSYAYNYDN